MFYVFHHHHHHHHHKGTDRTNIIALSDPDLNFPLPIEDERSLFHAMKVHWQANEGKDDDKMDV